MVSIAIDAMGGDFGPQPIIEGVIEALKVESFKAILVGRQSEIQPLVPEKYSKFITYCNCEDVFSMGEDSTDVFKHKDSSIYKSIERLNEGSCDAVVSAGHSGATMSLATLKVGRLKNILRPAIATLMPNIKNGKTLVLDVGANVDCKPEHLFQFAIMGEAYAKEVMNIKNPKIALLSNGEEDCKGNELVKGAHKLIKQLDSFVGNVEGGEIFNGDVDVVICDGFTGNVLLKTSEGVVNTIGKLIKNEVKKSPFAISGYVLMHKAFKKLKKQVDYDEYGGAPLLGVKKCVIISHGKSSPKAIKNAIFQAIKFSNSKINTLIENEISCFVDNK